MTATTASAADQIPLGAFSGGQTIESFEGFMSGVNIPVGALGPGYLQPGSVFDFDFGSGFMLTLPVPNPGQGGVLIGDFSLGNLTYGIGSSGFIDSADDVPFDSAFLIGNGFEIFYEVTFDTPQTRVGAFVAAELESFVSMTALDQSGDVLGTAMVDGVVVADWGTNFLGIEDADGIKTIRMGGSFFVLDNLMFEADDPPPLACPGDADGSGTVDFSDINSVLMHWLDSCP